MNDLRCVAHIGHTLDECLQRCIREMRQGQHARESWAEWLNDTENLIKAYGYADDPASVASRYSPCASPEHDDQIELFGCCDSCGRWAGRTEP